MMNDKFFNAAKEAAIQGTGTGGRGKGNFKLGAVLAHKNMLVSTGNNSYKTHPLMHRRTEWPFLHAEQSALIRNGLDNCEGKDLCVFLLWFCNFEVIDRKSTRLNSSH